MVVTPGWRRWRRSCLVPQSTQGAELLPRSLGPVEVGLQLLCPRDPSPGDASELGGGRHFHPLLALLEE